MKIFTYKDYIECIHTFRLHTMMRLMEESTEYGGRQKENNEDSKFTHDELIRNILKNKDEAAKFINSFIDYRRDIIGEDLITCTNSYINKRFKSKEADIIYKLKETEVFILIEYQSSIDYNMPYRILNYCVDIIQSWTKENRTKNKSIQPYVIPIVIYTGDKKWDVNTITSRQVRVTSYEENRINLSYNLIDLNRYTYEYLFKLKTIFANTMIMEKCKSEIELEEKIYMIIKNIENKRQLECIEKIVQYILISILKPTEQDQIVKEIEQKVGEKRLSTLIERLKEERMKERIAYQNMGHQIGEKIGEHKTIKEMSKILFKLGIDKEIIEKALTLKDEEIDKIAK